MLIDTDKPILLIDLGYAMFYRYSATQVWYKHSHPEEKGDLVKDYKFKYDKIQNATTNSNGNVNNELWKREDGKVLKPEGWTPPNLKPFV